MNKVVALLIVLVALTLLAGNVSAHTSIAFKNTSVALTGSVQQTLTGSFDINNTGHAGTTITFENLTLVGAGGKTLGINAISPVSNLAASQGQTVAYTITTANSFATTYNGQIVAKPSQNVTTETKGLPVAITINAAPGLSVTNPSVTVAKGLSKAGTFTLTNTGNTDLSSITLSLGTLSSGSNILPSSALTLSKTSTSILAGASEVLQLTISPPGTQSSGTYTGTLTVNFGTSTPATATVTVTVRDPVHSVKFNTSEIKFGSSTQERNTTLSVSFTVENDGDFAESVALSLTGVASTYNAVLSKTSMSLNAGATDSASLQLFVPASQDSGLQTIGQVGLSFSGLTVQKDVKLETASKLTIDDLDAEVDGSKDSDLTEGEVIDKKAEPDDDVELSIKVKNTFAKSTDIDIEDIEVDVVVEDIDDGDDLEPKEPKSFDLDADDSETVKVDFKVPNEVDDQSYTIVITATGQDKNGADHSASRKVKLRVEKKDDDVRVTKASLTTNEVSCIRTTGVRVEVRNFGADDQDDTVVAVTNQELGININVNDIKLDSDTDDDDNRYSQTFDLTVPESAAAGTYPIEVIVFINNDERMDKETVNLRVKDCTEKAETTETTRTTTTRTETTTQPTTTATSAATQPSSTATASIPESVETPFMETPAFLAVLVLANVVAVGALVLMVLKFLI